MTREVINPGNRDTLELLIAVMMATEASCVTVNRWEGERETERDTERDREGGDV